MAHLFESGFFVGKPAWHELGVTLEVAPATVQEGLIAAGLNWDVEKRVIPFTYVSDDGREINSIIENQQALVRKTDGKVLSVVGNSYEPFQNSEAFDFFNPFLESKLVNFETAGSLKGGRVIWILAKINDSDKAVVKNDPVSAYLLLATSHDRSLSNVISFTATRVVCNNTLSVALGEVAREAVANLKVRHSRKMREAMTAVQEVIDVTNRSFSVSVEAYQALAAKRLPIDGLKNYVREIFAFDKDNEKDPRALEPIIQSYQQGPGADLNGVYGTYWGAYNAVTHWIDHVKGRSADTRVHSSWFGDSAKVRERAFNIALNA